MFDNVEKTKDDKDIGFNIEIPEGFVLNKSSFEKSLHDLSIRKTKSMRPLLKGGITFSETPINFEDIDVTQIVGNSEDQGWSGLVKGMGEPTTQKLLTVDEVYKYANWILEMNEGKRREFIKDISLCAYEKMDGKREYYVYVDGRHRVMTFLALANLGIKITITNAKGYLLKWQ